MEIRRAEKRDIPGIVELLLQVGQVHHQIRPDIFCSGALKYDETALGTMLDDGRKPIFVALRDGFVAGYCFCQLREYNDGVNIRRKDAYIDDLCVEETLRGHGVAAALYNHAVQWARLSGCAFVTLNVWRGNDRAMGFYEKMGMTPRNITMEKALEDQSC